VAGETSSTDFPTTANAIYPDHIGGQDVFGAWLSPDGSWLVYAGYLGGSSNDYADPSPLAYDGAGNSYVAGSTFSSDFPTTPGAYQTTPGGGGDAYVTKRERETAISGTITYTLLGSVNKNLIIWGSENPGFPAGQHGVLYMQEVAPGVDQTISYIMHNVAQVRAYLYYFIDENDNGEPDIGEPFGYQGYMPGSSPNYTQMILDLVDQPFYTNVDVLLQPASLEPLYFNVHHENRPFGSFLVVAYKAYAPFTVSEFDHGSIPSGVHTYELYVTAVGDEWSGTDSPNIQPLDVPTLITPGDGDILGDTATFRWNAIAGAVRYRVELYEVGGSWTGGNVGYRVYSAYTADTTFTLTPGEILPGDYIFRLTAFDAADGNFSNRSASEYPQIQVLPHNPTPPAPLFAYTNVMSEARLDADDDPELFLIFAAKVLGPSPADTDSLTVTWPGGTTTTTLTQTSLHYDDFNGSYYWYRFPMPDPMPQGIFTFEVSNSADPAQTAQEEVTFSYTPVPIVDSSTIVPADLTYTGSATPTFTWGAVTIPGKTTYYRVEIYDWNERVWVYGFDRFTGTSFTPPGGVLQLDTPYQYRVQAGDGDTFTNEKNRSRSDFLGFYTGNPQATSFNYLGVRSDNRANEDMRLTMGVGVSLGELPTGVQLRVTSPNNSIDHVLDESNLWYGKLYGYEYWTGQYIPTPQDDTITYSLTTSEWPSPPPDDRSFIYSPVPIVDIGTLMVNDVSLASNAYLDSTLLPSLRMCCYRAVLTGHGSEQRTIPAPIQRTISPGATIFSSPSRMIQMVMEI
jgi:hypothetical protein